MFSTLRDSTIAQQIAAACCCGIQESECKEARRRKALARPLFFGDGTEVLRSWLKFLRDCSDL